MTPDEYKSRRKALALTQAALGQALGVNRAEINRREKGRRPITGEADAAIRWLTKGKRCAAASARKA